MFSVVASVHGPADRGWWGGVLEGTVQRFLPGVFVWADEWYSRIRRVNSPSVRIEHPFLVRNVQTAGSLLVRTYAARSRKLAIARSEDGAVGWGRGLLCCCALKEGARARDTQRYKRYPST
jgi:hypothetical protein